MVLSIRFNTTEIQYFNMYDEVTGGPYDQYS